MEQAVLPADDRRDKRLQVIGEAQRRPPVPALPPEGRGNAAGDRRRSCPRAAEAPDYGSDL